MGKLQRALNNGRWRSNKSVSEKLMASNTLIIGSRARRMLEDGLWCRVKGMASSMSTNPSLSLSLTHTHTFFFGNSEGLYYMFNIVQRESP